jgi:CheY-like chemotaxis protein
MHALIIEDEPMIALVIEDHLRALGYLTIAFAVTEEDAIAAARHRCPDLITSDVRLTSGCGITAVQEICVDRMIPVVFITASAATVRARIRNAVIVRKPFTLGHIEQALVAVSDQRA